MNILCLAIWCFLIIVTLIQSFNDEPISPVTAICAMIVCIVHYLEKIVS